MALIAFLPMQASNLELELLFIYLLRAFVCACEKKGRENETVKKKTHSRIVPAYIAAERMHPRLGQM